MVIWLLLCFMLSSRSTPNNYGAQSKNIYKWKPSYHCLNIQKLQIKLTNYEIQYVLSSYLDKNTTWKSNESELEFRILKLFCVLLLITLLRAIRPCGIPPFLLYHVTTELFSAASSIFFLNFLVLPQFLCSFQS